MQSLTKHTKFLRIAALVVTGFGLYLAAANLLSTLGFESIPLGGTVDTTIVVLLVVFSSLGSIYVSKKGSQGN